MTLEYSFGIKPLATSLMFPHLHTLRAGSAILITGSTGKAELEEGDTVDFIKAKLRGVHRSYLNPSSSQEREGALKGKCPLFFTKRIRDKICPTSEL